VGEERIRQGTALMRHLYLYVEGQTEQTFADAVLGPHLAQFEVYLMGAVLAEFGRKKQKVSRGGGACYIPFKRGLTSLIKQHDRPGVTISTMIDLYALPETNHCPIARLRGCQTCRGSTSCRANRVDGPACEVSAFQSLGEFAGATWQATSKFIKARGIILWQRYLIC
jgi:Domain of unknown function (DUF4276)